MRFDNFAAFTKRFPEEGKWISKNPTFKISREILESITMGRDITVRQRKQVRRKASGAEPPRVGDRLKDITVNVHAVYTDNGRGDERFVFRYHGSATWAGRFSNDDIIEGKAFLGGVAKREGYDINSSDADQQAANFNVTIKECRVAWVAPKGRNYVILEDVVVGSTPKKKKRAKPKAVLPEGPKIDFGFEERIEVAEKPATEIAGISELGAPIPDMSNWAAKFSD